MADLQTNTELPPTAPIASSHQAEDDISHLYRMSPTAGVATTDYAAINPVSIVALLLGLGGVLSLFGDILLIVPAVGFVLGVIALVQVRRSNRTQTGNGFAVFGIVLALAFGGFVVGRNYMIWDQKRADEARIASLLGRVGEDLAAERYNDVYGHFSQRFRNRVSPDAFAQMMKSLNQVPRLGKLTGVRWNGQPMHFESNPDSGEQTVTGMTFLQFELQADPQREYMKFVREGGPWVIEDIPQLFPPPKRAGGPGGARPGP